MYCKPFGAPILKGCEHAATSFFVNPRSWHSSWCTQDAQTRTRKQEYNSSHDPGQQIRTEPPEYIHRRSKHVTPYIHF